MTKPSSSSVLLLELEDLKEHMNRVQAEVGMCLTSLTRQSEEVCGVLARLETVTAIVRAVETVDRNKTVEKCSVPGSVQKSLGIFTHDESLGAAGCKESYCAFKEGEHHFPFRGKLNEKKIDRKYDENYINEEASELNINSPTFTPEFLINDIVMTSETTAQGLVALNDGAGEGSAVNIIVTADKDVKVMNTDSDIHESLDNVLRSTRPSLSRNRRKIVEETRDLKLILVEQDYQVATLMPSTRCGVLGVGGDSRDRKREKIREKIRATEDDNITVITSSNSNTVATKSVPSCLVPSYPKMSSPSSDTSGKTFSSSMVNSSSSMVNRVKEICRKQGWKVVGSYSTREGKEGCGVVHFYKLEVKGGEIGMLTRGVGVSKVEAVRRAFKTMENRLIGVDFDLGRNVETVKLRKQENLCDNNVNFPDEEILFEVKSDSRSEDSLSPPPLFHAKDCVAPDILGVKEFEDVDNKVHRTLTVSDDDAGAIIGREGARINRIRQEADVSILVEDLVEGSQGRLVKLWGKKASVDKAQQMIRKIILL